MLNKKGLKKCYGLLLVCFTIFGLLLNVSSDVNALSYDFNTFRIIPYRFVSGSSDSPAYYSSRFSIDFDTNTNSVPSTFDSDLLSNKYTTHYLEGGSCIASSYHLPVIHSSVSTGPPARFNVRGSNTNEFYLYSNISDSPFSNAFSCRNQSDFASDSLYTSSVDSVTGVPKKLINIPRLFLDHNTSSDLPNEGSGSIRQIEIPIDISMDTVGVIPSGTPISIVTGLVQESTSFPYLDSFPNAELTLSYFTDDSLSSRITSSITCSSFIDNNIFQSFNDDTLISWSGIQFTCDFTPTTSMRFVHGRLVLSGSSNSTPSGILLTYDYNDVYFTTTFLITNNDSTWSGLHANPQPQGSDLTLSPGYEQINGNLHTGVNCPEGDFLCQLSNLFNFSFINPFTAIFGFFNDQSSCAHIPTIASMIHSNEEVVCPWFPSSVRNIATPIIGMSAMMLLFGFCVHWLGARSGNLFEDSVATDSYAFRNKFRRN